MHALKRFGTAFGGYKMMENYPVPECGPDDIILEIKAPPARKNGWRISALSSRE